MSEENIFFITIFSLQKKNEKWELEKLQKMTIFFPKTFFSQKTKMWKIENCHFFLPAWNEKIGKIPLPPLAMMWCAKKSCSAKWQFSPSLNRGVGAIAEKFPIFLFQAWKVDRHEKSGNAIFTIFMKTLIFKTDFSKKEKFGFCSGIGQQIEHGRCTPVFHSGKNKFFGKEWATRLSTDGAHPDFTVLI